MDRDAKAQYARVLGHAGPCAESLFEPGSRCDGLYRAAYEARRRLAERLGADFEDRDLEALWRALEAIGDAAAGRMYACGRARERWARPTAAAARPAGRPQPASHSPSRSAASTTAKPIL